MDADSITIIIAIVATLLVGLLGMFFLKSNGSGDTKSKANVPPSGEAPSTDKEEGESKSSKQAISKSSAAKAAGKKKPSSKDGAKAEKHPLLARVLKGHAGPVVSIAFSPDGQSLASSSEDRSVRVWDLGSAKDSSNVSFFRINVELDYAVSLAFLTNNKGILAGTERQTQAQLFKLAGKNHEVAYTYKTGSKSAKVVSVGLGFSTTQPTATSDPYFRYVVVGLSDCNVCLFDMEGKLAQTFDSIMTHQSHVGVSPCGRFIGCSGFTPEVKIWAVKAGNGGRVASVEKAMSLAGHTSGVYHFSWSADSSRVASVSKDGTWRVFHIPSRWAEGEDPKLIASATFDYTESQAFHPRVALSPNGLTVAVSCLHGIEVFSADTGVRSLTIDQAHPGAHITALTYSHDGKFLASAATDKHIRLWINRSGVEHEIAKLRNDVAKLTNETHRKRVQEEISRLEKTLKSLPHV